MTQTARAALLVFLGDGVLTLMDSVMKGLAARYPTFEITFMRFAAGSIWALVLLAILRPPMPSWQSFKANGLRSLLVVLTSTCFFYALSKLPLAETIALSFLAPIFITLFGVVLLKERIDGRIVAALVTGFAGMLLISSGSIGQEERAPDVVLGIVAALLAMISYSLNIVLLRKIAVRDPAITIVAFQHFGPALLLAAPASTVWVAPTMTDLQLFLLVGALGVSGHMLLANGFARAEAATLAPIHYTTLVWAILFGWLFFGDVPPVTTLAGAALIVAGTLATQRRR